MDYILAMRMRTRYNGLCYTCEDSKINTVVDMIVGKLRILLDGGEKRSK